MNLGFFRSPYPFRVGVVHFLTVLQPGLLQCLVQTRQPGFVLSGPLVLLIQPLGQIIDAPCGRILLLRQLPVQIIPVQPFSLVHCFLNFFSGQPNNGFVNATHNVRPFGLRRSEYSRWDVHRFRCYRAQSQIQPERPYIMGRFRINSNGTALGSGAQCLNSSDVYWQTGKLPVSVRGNVNRQQEPACADCGPGGFPPSHCKYVSCVIVLILYNIKNLIMIHILYVRSKCRYSLSFLFVE